MSWRRPDIFLGVVAVYNRYAYEREKRDVLDLRAETKDEARNTGEKRAPAQAIDLDVQRFSERDRSAVAENCANGMWPSPAAPTVFRRRS